MIADDINFKFRVGLPSTNKHRKDEEVQHAVILLMTREPSMLSLVWTVFTVSRQFNGNLQYLFLKSSERRGKKF